MWEIPISVGILTGGALLGLRLWMDRMYPVKPKEVVLSEEWERRFQKLKESVDELTFGSKLRNNREEEL